MGLGLPTLAAGPADYLSIDSIKGLWEVVLPSSPNLWLKTHARQKKGDAD